MSVSEEVGTEVLEADVLVLGGGIAGCFAAIRARELGADVVLVDKANIGRSGLSHQWSGVTSYFDPEKDSYEDCYRECVEGGQWLVDQGRLEGMIYETTNRVHDLDKWGVKFQRDTEGRYIRSPGVGQKYSRIVYFTQGGFQMMSVVRGEVLRSGVRVVERVMVTDLLTSDGELPTSGRVAGVVGFNARNGKFYVIKAKSVVIATGPTTLLWRGYAWAPSLSGDGQAMAFRAGVEMRNYDIAFYRFHPDGFNCAPGANVLVGEGLIMVNARGERFMKRWDPVREERATAALVCRAMAGETQEGRGPILWDATHLDAAAHSRIEKSLPIVTRQFALKGLSLRKDKIPYSFILNDLGPGGIKTGNKYGATNVPGLFCGGAVTDHGEDGVSNVINHGMESAIGGHRAGEGAVLHSREMDIATVSEGQVQRLKEQIYAPLRRKAGMDYRLPKMRCDRVFDSGLLGPIRNEKKLKQALEEVLEIKEDLPKLVAKDPHELSRCIGGSNALLFPELISRCAVVRRESRGSHYREDCPEVDDANWLKWVVARRKGDDVEVWTEPVPFDGYPIKPGLARG
jgi:succinate dehydrogenase/fumarate reductase flavoprotein subunit